MDVKKPNPEKYAEALDQLLQVDALGMAKAIHRLNSELEKVKVENPIPNKMMFDLGITMGALIALQAAAPEKTP